MQAAPVPANEAERVAELAAFEILDTLPEQAYDDITFLAAEICGSPIALVSLIDGERQWFKSRVGLDASETHRDFAFCGHAILAPDDLMVVPDATADARFANNPLVVDDPGIRFYAGAPLVTESGAALGTLCVIDRVARELTDRQEQALRSLARQVMAQLELRRAVISLQEHVATRRQYEKQLEEYQRMLEINLSVTELDSLTDPLTGIGNRRAFDKKLEEECDRWTRYETPLSLLVIDIDHFKDYNDEFGHPAGDVALRAIAGSLSDHSRATDHVGRLGGEEFGVILCDTSAAGAAVMAERFRRSIADGHLGERPITISVGVATAAAGDTPAELLAGADTALYAAKAAGRNQVASH